MITSVNTSISEPAAAKAYRALERMIVTLELAPGSVATEGALIERLGLGRTPVREAIQRLAWEGLLEVRPRAGLAIAPLHPGDWLRVIDARRGVEIVLARSAARFVTREAAARFHDAALAMQKAVVAGDVIALPRSRQGARRGAGAGGRQSVRRARRRAAADPQPPLLVPLQSRHRASPKPPSVMSALIRSILEGDEKAAAAEAERLMALLGSHAEAAARDSRMLMAYGVR